MHIMLDLETMSLAPNAAIISIGAVEFTLGENGRIVREFKMNVDLSSSAYHGLHIDPNTVKWWMSQSEEAKKSTFTDTCDLAEAIGCFTQWIDDGRQLGEEVYVWGNGAAADNVWIDSAYKAVCYDKPWRHTNDRCFRTVKSLYPKIEISDEAIAHDSLCDARWQARYLIELFGVKNAKS